MLSCVGASGHCIPMKPRWPLSDQRQIGPRCKMATPEQWWEGVTKNVDNLITF